MKRRCSSVALRDEEHSLSNDGEFSPSSRRRWSRRRRRPRARSRSARLEALPRGAGKPRPDRAARVRFGQRRLIGVLIRDQVVEHRQVPAIERFLPEASRLVGNVARHATHASAGGAPVGRVVRARRETMPWSLAAADEPGGEPLVGARHARPARRRASRARRPLARPSVAVRAGLVRRRQRRSLIALRSRSRSSSIRPSSSSTSSCSACR